MEQVCERQWEEEEEEGEEEKEEEEKESFSILDSRRQQGSKSHILHSKQQS